MMDVLIGLIALILGALIFLMMIGAVMTFASIASGVLDAFCGKRCGGSRRCPDCGARSEAD